MSGTALGYRHLELSVLIYILCLKAMVFPQAQKINEHVCNLTFVSIITQNDKKNESNLPLEGWFVIIMLR